MAYCFRKRHELFMRLCGEAIWNTGLVLVSMKFQISNDIADILKFKSLIVLVALV